MNLYLHNPTGKSVRNLPRSLLQTLILAKKRCGSYSKWPAVHRKLSGENQCYDWIKSIHWYQLVNNGWLADINLFLTRRFYLFNHNPSERKYCGKAWLIRVHTLQILWDSVHILTTYTRTQQSLPPLWAAMKDIQLQMYLVKLIPTTLSEMKDLRRT